MRGSPTTMPADWIPLKTPAGWTAVQLRYDGDKPAGFITLKDSAGKMQFWSRRYRMTNDLTTWAVFAELDELRAKVQRYEAQVQPAALGSIA